MDRKYADPEWWLLLVWSRIYFALKALDLAIRAIVRTFAVI
jgi:hypothetical protein